MLLSGITLMALLAGVSSGALKANAGSETFGHNTGLRNRQQRSGRIAPKVVVVSMFDPEAEVWYENATNSTLVGNITANLIPVPGLSPLYPFVYCNERGEVCQLTVGESEINAATSMMAFALYRLFDLSKTYFLLAGIAGINPKLGTLGSVALSRFSVQVALQYEIDAREMPANFSTGYLPYGAYTADEYPSTIYGTEVMEVNENLRDAAAAFAQRAKLADSASAAEYRDKYHVDGGEYAAATNGPGVIKCDTATADVYYSGILLSEAFENTTKLWTNQSTITYCASAQEDSATLQALMRVAIPELVDFSRVILMRTGSDFDRPPPSISAFQHLRIVDQGGFSIAIQNIYLAGIKIVEGILDEWDSKYHDGIKPTNYIGDIFGTLGGEPDFGSKGSWFNGTGFSPTSRTEVGLQKRRISPGRKGKRAGGWK